MTPVTNAQFLSTIFTDLADEYCWTTAFAADPNAGVGWAGNAIMPKRILDTPTLNTYFSVSALKGDPPARQTAKFSRLMCVVLDDIKECYMAPTWRIETSPNNYQIGFKLSEPVTDVEVATRLHKALGQTGIIPNDKNGNNPVRYVRLPVGRNTKNGGAFSHRLDVWEPNTTVSLRDLCDALQLDYASITGSTSAPAQKPAQADLSHGLMDYVSDEDLIAQIANGESYHDPILKLTARYITTYKMPEQAVVEVMQGFMRASYDNTPRWQARYDDISRMTRDACKKFSKPADMTRFPIGRADILEQGTPNFWWIKKYLPHGEVGMVVGASGAGKSFLAFDMAACIARGLPWQGHKTHRGAVLYIVAEGKGGMRLRKQAYDIHHGVSLQDSPFYFLTAAPSFLDDGDVGVVIERVKQIKVETGLDVLVIPDTWAQVTSGSDESGSKDMGPALAACRRIHDETGAMVLPIAHFGKDETKGLRGWSGQKGALDVQLDVLINEDKTERKLRIEKLKDGREDQPEVVFSLQDVHLGMDDDLDPITSAVVVYAGASVAAPVNKARPRRTQEERKVDAAWEKTKELLQRNGDMYLNQLKGYLGDVIKYPHNLYGEFIARKVLEGKLEKKQGKKANTYLLSLVEKPPADEWGDLTQMTQTE
jgi:hypothetical protein